MLKINAVHIVPPTCDIWTNGCNCKFFQLLVSKGQEWRDGTFVKGCPQSAALRQQHKTSPAGLQHCTMQKFVKAEKRTFSPFTGKWIWAQLHVPFLFLCVRLLCINVKVQFQLVLMWNLLPWCTNFSLNQQVWKKSVPSSSSLCFLRTSSWALSFLLQYERKTFEEIVNICHHVCSHPEVMKIHLYDAG